MKLSYVEILQWIMNKIIMSIMSSDASGPQRKEGLMYMHIYPAGKAQISTVLFMSALYLLLLQEIRSRKQTSQCQT